MLVLCRQAQESVMIGDNIEIVIVGIKGNKVRIGITAPRSMSVHRREIYDAIAADRKAAADDDRV